MQNLEIRQAAKVAGIHLWQLAEVVGMQDSNFSRKIRHELPEEEKQKLLAAIEKLSKGA